MADCGENHVLLLYTFPIELNAMESLLLVIAMPASASFRSYISCIFSREYSAAKIQLLTSRLHLLNVYPEQALIFGELVLYQEGKCNGQLQPFSLGSCIISRSADLIPVVSKGKAP